MVMLLLTSFILRIIMFISMRIMLIKFLWKYVWIKTVWIKLYGYSIAGYKIYNLAGLGGGGVYQAKNVFLYRDV